MSPDPDGAAGAGDDSEHAPLIALSSDMLGTIGFDGRLKTLNASWECSLGYGQQELLSTPLLDLVHCDDHTETAEALVKAACVDKEHTAVVNRCRCRDGSHKWIAWRLKASPQKKLYYASARDVTQQVLLDKEFLQDQKMSQLGRLAASVAHDFNNILAAIRGCATLLETSPRIAQEDRKDVEDILQASRCGMEFIRDILDYGRVDKWPECGGADLGVAFDRMERLLQRLLRDDITLVLTTGEDLRNAKIGASRLDQILLNLVTNARDALPAGGRIELKATRSGDFARLSVTDTGVGMPPDVLARIGEPFFTTKGEGKGTGLGLATVHKIVADCGGRIAVRSAPGEGTTFEISLPLVEEG